MASEKDTVSSVVADGHVGAGAAATVGSIGLASPENQSQVGVEDCTHPRIRMAVVKLGLTQRESQIVEKFAIGKSTQALASELFISAATVRTHLRKIFTKLKIGSRVELLSMVVSRILEEIDDRAD